MTDSHGAKLLLGPLLRRVVGTRATIWVETSAPAVVEVRAGNGAGGQAPTFSAFEHHYALVVVEGLPEGGATPYQVLVDGAPVWPLPESSYPPSVIRTRLPDDGDQPVRLVFGSCRETTQHATARRLPPDALDAFARRLMRLGWTGDDWPDLVVLLGDQVYADKPSPGVRRHLHGKRKASEDRPKTQVVTYDEYTKLYLESWRDPEIRWLFSTVPSVMIFDDHEIIDDWNSSAAWRADIRTQAWWPERISSGLASYWVYQHLGNIGPDALAADPIYAKVLAAEDATEILRELGARVDAEVDIGPDQSGWSAREYQWSYALDIGRTRLVMLDNRCSRVLEPSHRSMLPPSEWSWFLDRAHGSYDHLVVAFSLPWLMPTGIHHVEAWNERLARSRRPWVARVAERLRRRVDLEHWGAFHTSFDALSHLFQRLGSGTPSPDHAGRVGAGEAYDPPASISVLSGDVHHSYVAKACFGPEVTAPVHQLTCSPIHNQVPGIMRPLMRLGWASGPAAATRALARAAGVADPMIRWAKLAGPYFGNAVGVLVHSGRTAAVTIEGTTKEGDLLAVASVPLTDRERRPAQTG